MSKVQGSVRLTPEAWAVAREIARRLSEDLGGQISVAQAIEVALREKARRDEIPLVHQVDEGAEMAAAARSPGWSG